MRTKERLGLGVLVDELQDVHVHEDVHEAWSAAPPFENAP